MPPRTNLTNGLPITSDSQPPKDVSRRQAEPANAAKPRTPVAPYQCLVVSVTEQRREMLMRAAVAGGWQTLVAADGQSARKHLARMFVQLAIVDLEQTPLADATEFQEIMEDLAGMTGLLLVVCGNEGEPLEEIWARQLGVWLYLPGLTAGDDLSVLCGEARQITEQLHMARQFHGPHASVNGPNLSE